MLKCYEPYASCEPTNDCHQMTFLTTRSAARILIRNLGTSQTNFAAHASSRLFSGRVDQTRESGGNRAYRQGGSTVT